MCGSAGVAWSGGWRPGPRRAPEVYVMLHYKTYCIIL